MEVKFAAKTVDFVEGNIAILQCFIYEFLACNPTLNFHNIFKNNLSLGPWAYFRP
jgi:hypothetical protein